MDKKYKIDYNSNKPFNYITIAEDSMLPYYDKVLEKIKENNLSLDDKISKEKFRENIKKFNDYQRYIANYIS